ncbi:MAG: ABC transporter permease, partial [Candidatus Omnitrophica bacterium]|nr:ABC transporter permease [Candidatus Omnitrophota bacterium]
DRLLSGFAFVGISVPSFFLALLLLCFSAKTGWFPIGGVASIRYEEFSALGKFADRIHHLILPTLVLVVCSFGGLFRVMRGNFLENLRAPYVTPARAKGLSEGKVIYKHILRNSVNPLITIFGYELSGLLSGVALVEIILSWPGLGRLMLEAVMTQDLYVVMASLLVGGVLLILGNLIADILLAFADPRIRYR